MNTTPARYIEEIVQIMPPARRLWCVWGNIDPFLGGDEFTIQEVHAMALVDTWEWNPKSPRGIGESVGRLIQPVIIDYEDGSFRVVNDTDEQMFAIIDYVPETPKQIQDLMTRARAHVNALPNIQMRREELAAHRRQDA